MTDQTPSGFSLPRVEINTEEVEEPAAPITSSLSPLPAVPFAQLETLVNGEGSILYHPLMPLSIGDVLYLRQRAAPLDGDATPENGVIVQVISTGTASYPAADQKSLFRLMSAVRAAEIHRSHNEPPEVIDEFMMAEIRVRASIRDGSWVGATGQAVTRNVDIFVVDPEILLTHITEQVENLNLNVGDYHDRDVVVYGGGFEKINLITGMKGSGKSHMTKGIINESRICGVSAIVFDINDEYGGLPASRLLEPGVNFQFRIDRMAPDAFLRTLLRLAPPGEATTNMIGVRLPRAITDAITRSITPDLDYLIGQIANQIIPGAGTAERSMQQSLERSLETLRRSGLFMSTLDSTTENAYVASLAPGAQAMQEPARLSMTGAMAATIEAGPSVLVVRLAGLGGAVQKSVVQLVLDHVQDVCRRQTAHQAANPGTVAIYPSIYFEEAHMYMDEEDIDRFLPVIRHVGPNLFFITNTPGALPESVVRLVDNLVITKLINRRDVARVQDCGLADAETIESYARNLEQYHALLLSQLAGCTHGFPLVFRVRDFGLPASGRSLSMWQSMRTAQGN